MPLKNLKKVSTFLLTLTLLASARTVRAQSSGDFADLDSVAAAELRATNTPGCAIAVVRGEEVVVRKGLGLANVETGQAVTPEMLFRLGSTTKMFTAAAL